jgi:hypothetical protein
MKKLVSVTFLCIIVYASALAQFDAFHYNDDLSLTPDSTARRMSKTMKILSEFRLQMYTQTEWQHADTSGKNSSGPLGIDGVGSYQGGTFPAAASNRFLQRRTRFKVSFEHKNSKDLKILEFAFQLEAFNYNNGLAAPSSLVKEAYGRLIDPWIGWFSLQGGIFNRPFGYETPSNPAFAESPEFARVNQTMLPNEAELGAGIIVESPAKFEKVYLRLDAFAVNGVGIGVGAQSGAYMNRKDFIGRIKVGKMWNVNSSTKLGLNASASYYNGGVLQTTPFVYVLEKDPAGQLVYTNIGNASGILTKSYTREYYGGHLELKADYALGITTLRGEFMAGVQPGSQNSTLAPTGLELNYYPAATDLYIRRFAGGSALFTQSFKQKVKNHLIMHDITFKYDVYDPQTLLKGSQLNIVSNNYAITDIKYTTLGFGYSIIPYNWFKLMIWYDWVINENTNIPGYYTDFRKDNVLTIRTQFYIDTWWFNARNKYKDNLMQKKY